MSSSSTRSRFAVATVAIAVFSACLVSGWAGEGLLCLLPALGCLLLLRRYPGERVLIAWRRKYPRRRVRAAVRIPMSSSVAAALPRGGLLIAHSLAVRPPPAPRVLR